MFTSGINSVFLNVTPEEWGSKVFYLNANTEMPAYILDKNPFSEAYYCKVSSVDEESLFHGMSDEEKEMLKKELINLIRNDLNGCEKII